MIDLDVYFDSYDAYDTDGTAVLYENLITNRVHLVLNNHLVLGEIKHFIKKAENILKKRYAEVNVKIHWETAKKEEKEDVITSK